MWPDAVNGLFEILGGFAILDHCRQLYKDKMVRGASWKAVAFFTVWGYWNLFFYPHLDQWWSFSGGVFIAATNMLWIGMMLYYIRREKELRALIPEPEGRSAMLAKRVRLYSEINDA